MNWIDVLIIFIVITNLLKGYSLGLILSLFNILQVIISLFITKNYYMLVYNFIKDSSFLLTGFNRVFYFIFRIIFYRKNKVDPNYLDNLMKTSILDVLLVGFSIIFVYKISTIVIDILFSLFSFLLDIRLFRKIDRYGGMLFGLLKGFLLIFIMDGVLRPIFLELPGLAISEAFLNSRILELLVENNWLMREGMVYEKTRHIIWNIVSVCRSFILII